MTVLSDQVKKHTINTFKCKNSRYHHLKLSYQKSHLVPQSLSKYLNMKKTADKVKRLQSCSAGLQLQYKSVTLKSLKSFLCSVPAARVSESCPDCPSHTAFDNAEVQKTVSSHWRSSTRSAQSLPCYQWSKFSTSPRYHETYCINCG